MLHLWLSVLEAREPVGIRVRVVSDECGPDPEDACDAGAKRRMSVSTDVHRPFLPTDRIKNGITSVVQKLTKDDLRGTPFEDSWDGKNRNDLHLSMSFKETSEWSWRRGEGSAVAADLWVVPADRTRLHIVTDKKTYRPGEYM